MNRNASTFARAMAVTLCVTASRSPRLEAQKQFEGVIIAESNVNRKPLAETLYVKGTRWRLDGYDPSPQALGAYMVGDDKGQILLMFAPRKFYMKQPVATDLDQAVDLVTFTKLGKRESVAGNQCEYYAMQFKNSAAMDRQFCVATDLGFVGFTPEVRVHEGLAGTGIGAVARRKFPGGFVVLKAIDKSGKVVFVANKIERRTLGDDVFDVPPGWAEAPTRGRPPQ